MWHIPVFASQGRREILGAAGRKVLGDAAWAFVQVSHSPLCWVRLCLGCLSPGQGRPVGILLGAVMEPWGTKDWLGREGRKETLVSGAGWEAGVLALPRLPAELAPAEGVSWHANAEGEGERGSAGRAGCGCVTQPAALSPSRAAV